MEVAAEGAWKSATLIYAKCINRKSIGFPEVSTVLLLILIILPL